MFAFFFCFENDLNINWLSDSLFHFQSPAIDSLIFHLWRLVSLPTVWSQQLSNKGSDPMQASQQTTLPIDFIGPAVQQIGTAGHALCQFIFHVF